MARPHFHASLPFTSIPITLFLLVVAVFSVFSVITFLCSSRKVKKFQPETMEVEEAKATTSSHESKDKSLISKLNSNLSKRALSTVKLLSWRKVQAEQEEEEYSDDEGEQVLWRKNILMGERCRPLDFSDKIV